ncbi:MAG TPA: hypothetical protein VGO67_08475 [Verrucomicrobiae bacterium]|jgi:hypothetical protein
MNSETPSTNPPKEASRPARIYVLKPFAPPQDSPTMDAGPGRSGASAPPASALIYQKSHNCIEIDSTGEKSEEKPVATWTGLAEKLPGRLHKKMLSIDKKIQGMVEKFGIEHIAMQTLTIRENITDGKEFNRRFHSIATNVFPKLYQGWLRVYERQERGAWHVHVVVATKIDIRTGSNPAALNRLLKARKDATITKAVYYSGIQKLASPNLRSLWKEFRRLCGLKEFKKRRSSKGKRYYKFDASHMVPLIESPKALASYVSKYIQKGFKHRRAADKGMRLVGCSKNVSRICSEQFSWSEGAGRVWRMKLGSLAGMLGYMSNDDFAKALGCRWAYHIRPVMNILMLPHYPTMKEARADGWDLVNKADGSPWPWPDLDLPRSQIQAAQTEAFKLIKSLIQRRRGKPKRRSRVEMGWDPERWEEIKKEKREFKIFKPPSKPKSWSQDEFMGLDGPDCSHIIKD